MWARLAILIIAPPLLVWTFLSTFWREARLAPWFAWNECRIEMHDIRAAWRAKSHRPKDYK